LVIGFDIVLSFVLALLSLAGRGLAFSANTAAFHDFVRAGKSFVPKTR
jgi:hypothetical protein